MKASDSSPTPDDDLTFRRVQKSAKHVLAAVVFRESAAYTMENAGSFLLASIGHYYASYHMAVGLLAAQPTVPMEALHRLRHGEVRGLLEQNLVQPGHLDRSFVDGLLKLQTLREYANYDFGSKADVREDLAPDPYALTGEMFQVAVNCLKRSLAQLHAGFAFCVSIGDDIGSDLIKLHCNEEIGNRVWEFLIAHELTT